MLTEAAIAHRRASDDRLKEYLRFYLAHESETVPELEELLEVTNLRVPTEAALLQMGNTIDIISAVLNYKGRHYALIDFRDDSSSPDGVGKTSALTELLGINIDYDSFRRGFDNDRTESRGDISFAPTGHSLAVSDIGYYGISEGRLAVARIIGERILFLSDLARHIYRRIAEEYSPETFQAEKGKEGFKKVLYQLRFIDVRDCFYIGIHPYKIDLVILIKRNREDLGFGMSFNQIEPSEFRDRLFQGLLNPLYHRSPHWGRVQEIHRNIAEQIAAGCETIPAYMAIMPASSLNYPIEKLVENIREVVNS